MIGHSKAFATYRELSQKHLNFVVLVCHAVPALRAELAASTVALQHPPDHFKISPRSALSAYAADYQNELSRTTLVTIFSFFESYVKDVLNEIVSFHGGAQALKDLAHVRASAFLAQPPALMQKSKRKLQEPPKKVLKAKYQKHSKLLDESGFRFPTELLAHFGVVHLLSKTDEKRGMRAWEVPDILEGGLLFPLSQSERTHFEQVRGLRNKIAHGKTAAVSLQGSLRTASDLHALAAKIDKHVVEHFFVLQSFL